MQLYVGLYVTLAIIGKAQTWAKYIVKKIEPVTMVEMEERHQVQLEKQLSHLLWSCKLLSKFLFIYMTTRESIMSRIQSLLVYFSLNREKMS